MLFRSCANDVPCMASSVWCNILRARARRKYPFVLRCWPRALAHAFSASIQLDSIEDQSLSDIEKPQLLFQLEVGGGEVELVVGQFGFEMVRRFVMLHCRIIIALSKRNVALPNRDEKTQKKKKEREKPAPVPSPSRP